jgi:hypothetical protein
MVSPWFIPPPGLGLTRHKLFSAPVALGGGVRLPVMIYYAKEPRGGAFVG